ncbi:hypothetical protein KZ813_16890 [Sphingomonas sp. RHCKR7]|uniref:hypothetical protein n=1 Tax=Sphingomonas folli TaxID=2862497 RepID=UPI001CA5F3E8|nr:hypothetical protein [Sphingomonas folli]MBW6528521.1 hypothetical protein [Sphingomonas folli]
MTEHIDMLDDLDRHYGATRQWLALLRRACASPTPDAAVLCRARHGLIATSIRRSKYIQDTVFPAVARNPAILSQLSALDGDLSRKRALSSRHVSKWSLDAVLGDWSGYRTASARVARGIEDRIRLEQSILLPALRALATKGSDAENARAAADRQPSVRRLE